MTFAIAWLSGGQPTGVTFAATAVRIRTVASPASSIRTSFPASRRAAPQANGKLARVGFSEPQSPTKRKRCFTSFAPATEGEIAVEANRAVQRCSEISRLVTTSDFTISGRSQRASFATMSYYRVDVRNTTSSRGRLECGYLAKEQRYQSRVYRRFHHCGCGSGAHAEINAGEWATTHGRGNSPSSAQNRERQGQQADPTGLRSRWGHLLRAGARGGT